MSNHTKEVKITGSKSSEAMDKFVIDGNEAVEFKLVKSVKDFESTDKTYSFNPSMCHQIFSEGETIFGYENLKIKVYYTAGALNTYIGINYTRKLTKELCDGVEPDNIILMLEKVIPSGYTTNLDEFSKIVENDSTKFVPFGELIDSFKVQIKPSLSNGNHSLPEATEKTFEIYYCDTTIPKFRKYQEKMESFTMWFIDAASFLDLDDEKWKFFVMFEKYKSNEGENRYTFVGYSSAYNFYSYPQNIRPRVAQMMILPPYQRKGLGVSLLSTIYQHYRSNPLVNEITVEDPSDDFERLRDYVDARDCLKLPTYNSNDIKKGFSNEMAEEARKVLKLTKRQAQRMYEIIRLKNTNVNSQDDLKDFRLDVKKRLNIPYDKQKKELTRMKKRKPSSVEGELASIIDDATRKTELESNFNVAFAHYESVLKRLEIYGQ